MLRTFAGIKGTAPARTDARRVSHQSHSQLVVFASDAARDLRDTLVREGKERPMLVCSARTADSPFFNRLVAEQGELSYIVFPEAREHPSVEVAVRGAREAQDQRADCVVGIGGGSAIDLAKGLVLSLFSDVGDVAKEPGFNSTAREPTDAFGARLVFAVPTTLSGAQCTSSVGLVSRDGRKAVFRDARVVPSIVILATAAIETMDSKVMASTGLSGLAHCLEASYSALRDPISTMYASHGFPLLYRSLLAILTGQKSQQALQDALLGAHLAGLAIENARTSLHAALCHVIGASGVPHGIAHGILLPHVLRFNAARADSLLFPLTASIVQDSRPTSATEVAVACVERIRHSSNLPRQLREVGVRWSSLTAMATAAAKAPGIAFNPTEDVTEQEILGLLEAAW